MDSPINDRSPLLSPNPYANVPETRRYEDDGEQKLKQGLLWRLYISHFLSTWNMRSYEFTVILLFAAAYPDDLRPTSIRGVLTNGATLLFSPAVGRWVDRNASRFHTMKITILVQRACIVAGCLLWMLLFLSAPAPDGSKAPPPGGSRLFASVPKDLLVAAVVALCTLERVCAVGNNLVMERDWVPTIASEVSRPPLHALNATMRRIDLVSKILAPVVTSVVAIHASPAVLALLTACLNAATVGVELATARSAFNRCAALKLAREAKPGGPLEDAVRQRLGDGEEGGEEDDYVEPVTDTAAEEQEKTKRGLRLYFSNDAWLASISAALQSFSVMSLSGPMTTYLLTRHYSLSVITTARTVISIIEIGSTVVFPLMAAILRRYPFRLLPDPMAVIGVSGITFQLLLLVPCFMALVLVPTNSPDPAALFPAYTVLIFVFLGLSRLGHWTHNMAVQQIVQTRVPAAHRVEFSGVEMTFVSGAEIGRWASAAVWNQPEQFKGVALAGVISVGLIWVFFATWTVKTRRRVGVVPLINEQQ